MAALLPPTIFYGPPRDVTMGQRLRIRTPDVHAQRSPRIDLRLPHIDVSPRSGRHTGGHSSFTAEANARASGFLARISERPIPFDATAAAHAAVGALGPSQRRSRKRSILMPSRKKTVLGAGLATQVLDLLLVWFGSNP